MSFWAGLWLLMTKPFFSLFFFPVGMASLLSRRRLKPHFLEISRPVMDMQGRGKIQGKFVSVPKHRCQGLELQQETMRKIYLFIYFYFNEREINCLFTGKCMWGEGVMTFHIKLGQVFPS